MAPFLVILLLLALGAGIIAWHTTGPHYGPKTSARRPQPAKSFAPSTSVVEEIVASPEPQPIVRSPTSQKPEIHR